MRQQTCRLRAGGVLLALTFAAAGVLGLPSTSPAAAASSALTYYVSLGDSYSVGYQPGLGATPGYTVYVAKKTHLKLVNFGCGGATTTSIIAAVGCPDPLPHTTGAVLYPTTTQAAAAEAFLTSHRGHIGLITVSISGNDVTSCAGQPNPVSCVGTATKGISTNVTALVAALRTAAGPGVPLIGLTYPDVILGSYVYPSRSPTASSVSLAKLSVVAFKDLINPALTKAYATAGGRSGRRDCSKWRVHLAEPDHPPPPLRQDPGARSQRVQADVVLCSGQHPRHDAWLHLHRQTRRRQVRRHAAQVRSTAP